MFGVSSLLLALSALAQQSSVPTSGNFARFRLAPRNSMLSIVPVDGAEFIPGQKFDISIELHAPKDSGVPDLSNIQVTIDGKPASEVLGKPMEKVESWEFQYFTDLKSKFNGNATFIAVSRVAIRSASLIKPGKYNIRVAVGDASVDAEYVVRDTGSRKVKNVVLMIGDGMASPMITAARYLSRETRFGKFGQNLLNMEQLGSIGKVITNGIDSIITDSANSAAAYNTGQKGEVNSLNVYSDTSENSLDDAKVETLAEMIRRIRPNMCIGVVTTAEVQDATPAAVYSHTRNRDDKAFIVDQMINGFKHNNITWDPKPVKADVLFGGGGAYYCAGASCKSLNGTDYYEEYKKAGYVVVNSRAELNARKDNSPIVGIFHSGNMNTWLDRNVFTENLKGGSPTGDNKNAIDQPSLEEMVKVAIDIMSAKCSDGFYLMAEGASVDKAMHANDYDRGLGELLELDRTVKYVNDWRKKNIENGDTAIIVTADHAQAFDVYGAVDTGYFNELPEQDTTLFTDATGEASLLQIQKRQALGEYEAAGWPDLVVDSNGMPTKWDGRFRLLAGKVDATQHREDFQVKKSYRKQTVEDKALSKIYGKKVNIANPDERGIFYTPTGGVENTSTVHSLQAVDLYCAGPVSFTSRCSRVMDNTEVFFMMAEALGLAETADSSAVTSTLQSAATSTATSAATSAATTTEVSVTANPTATVSSDETTTVSSNVSSVTTSVATNDSGDVVVTSIVASVTTIAAKDLDGSDYYDETQETIAEEKAAAAKPSDDGEAYNLPSGAISNTGFGAFLMMILLFNF